MENQSSSVLYDPVVKKQNSNAAEKIGSQSNNAEQSPPNAESLGHNVVTKATFHHHHHHQGSPIIERNTASATAASVITSPQEPVRSGLNSISEFHHHHIHHSEKTVNENWKGNKQLRRRRVNTGLNSAIPSNTGALNSKGDISIKGDQPGAETRNAEKWTKLQNLKMLFDEGFISKEEYVGRRSQIIDDMTGTNHSALPERSISSLLSSSQFGSRVRRRPSRVLNPYVIPRPPPSDFSAFQPETAIRHFFDLQKRVWTQEPVMVRMDDTPFARGGLRLVYHLQEVKKQEAAALMNTREYISMYNDHVVGDRNSDPYNMNMMFADVDLSLQMKEPENALGDLIEEEEEDEIHNIDSDLKANRPNLALSNSARAMESTNEETLESISTDAKPVIEYATDESKLENKEGDDGLQGKITLVNGDSVKKTSYVAKLAIDPYEDPGTYFRDVEMQAHCAYYAMLFNRYEPPRRVEFCKAWILELIERENSPICGVEKFITGSGSKYRKHNNNFGYVSEDERNTPQAFSHFTYEASAHTMLVVDIQGVGDMYTDPQIHTIRGTDFGKGNLGVRGIKRFLETHRCNSICRYLKLPAVNPKGDTVDSTMPVKPLMPHARIDRQQFAEGHYYESTPYLQKMLHSRSVISQMSTAQSSVYAKKQRWERRHRGDESTYWDLSDDLEGCFAHCPSCTIL